MHSASFDRQNTVAYRNQKAQCFSEGDLHQRLLGFNSGEVLAIGALPMIVAYGH